MKIRIIWLVPILIILVISSIWVWSSYKNKTSIAISKLNLEELKKRLANLEPAKPSILYDYELMSDRNLSGFDVKTVPIKSVIEKGNELTFASVYHDPEWIRPAYHPNWHSTNYRWSYVPFNLALQQHKLFSFQGGLSYWYDLSNSLALPKEADRPSPFSKNAFTIKYPYVTRLILFDAKLQSIKYLGKQLAIIVLPQRSGIQVIDFEHKQLPEQLVLLQMVTPDGYELDYQLLNIPLK